MSLFDIQIQIYVGGNMENNRIEFLNRNKPPKKEQQAEAPVYIIERPPRHQELEIFIPR
jgi:predicted DNA-binding protein (UPF0278 family)